MSPPDEVSRRDLIVHAAREQFTSRGYDATKIGDLADELGISKAAITYYFPTKDTFLDELVAPFVDDLDEAIDEAMDPRDAVHAYLTAVTEHHDVAVWLDTDQTLQQHEDLGARLAKINRRVVAIITDRSRRKSDRIRALSVLGGVWRPAREIPTRDLRDHHDDIVDAALASY